MSIMRGIDVARSFIGKERATGIGEALHVELLSVDDGLSVCEGVLGGHALNAIGFAHGGYITTLLDAACGYAVLSQLDSGKSCVTIELKTTFLKGFKANVDRIRAEGRILSANRKIAFAEAKLFGSTGVLYATASASFLLVDLDFAAALSDESAPRSAASHHLSQRQAQ